MKRILGLLLMLIVLVKLDGQTLYYPPATVSATWETKSPESLGWKMNYVDSLYRFLEGENTKAFIVLKDGKIVLEKYFGTFTADSVWYWASAGKTLTSFLVGKAAEDGFLSINDLTSKYLGVGWTSCTLAQESKITIRHQLTMTSGLDDGVVDNHCTSRSCLQYKADAGTRWAYHNAPYTLLESVIEKACSQNINLYTQSKLKAKTGMTGLWFMSGDDNVFFSTARSMARFGLLAQDHFKWNGEPLLVDTAYVRALTSTSQSLNLSYGYLWWLNGKSSYMLPTTQFVFQGSYASSAPADMFAGLGKNGQIVSVSPSQGLVVVRMGNQPGSPAADIAPQLCNQIWDRLQLATGATTDVHPGGFVSERVEGKMLANGTGFELNFAGMCDRVVVFDMKAQPQIVMLSQQSGCKIDISGLTRGVYIVRLKFGDYFKTLRFVK